MYGAYIGAAINRAGLSPDEVAERIGISGDAVRKWIRNTNPPKLETLERLARALGCLIGDLLPNSGGGTVAEHFQPIAAGLMGLSGDEIREQILILASQATLNRNAILRRVEREAPTERIRENPQPSTGEPTQRYGVDEGVQTANRQGNLNAPPGRHTKNQAPPKIARRVR